MAKDLYHQCVKIALQKEGWIITDDPLNLSVKDARLLADLGAEQIIEAENNAGIKIAVEIKSFIAQSDIHEFHLAMGQYDNYRMAIEELGQEREVYLAINEDTWQFSFKNILFKKSFKKRK